VIFKVCRLKIEMKGAGITEPIIDQGNGHNARGKEEGEDDGFGFWKDRITLATRDVRTQSFKARRTRWR
jgi:hypothetical protein